MKLVVLASILLCFNGAVANPAEESGLIDTLVAEVRSLQHELGLVRQELGSVRQELNVVREELADHQSHAKVDDKLAFGVASHTNFGSVSVDTNIPFDIVHANVAELGGGWNGGLNSFLAPVAGVYSFSASAASGDGDIMRVSIVVTDNYGSTRVSSLGSSASGTMGDANSIVIQLNAFDYVSAQIVTGSNTIISSPTDVYSTFSGFLIFQL